MLTGGSRSEAISKLLEFPAQLRGHFQWQHVTGAGDIDSLHLSDTLHQLINDFCVIEHPVLQSHNDQYRASDVFVTDIPVRPRPQPAQN